MNMRDLRRQLEAQGWTWGVTRRGHIKVVSPTGEPVIASGTPSDRRRSIHNFIAILRRKGANL